MAVHHTRDARVTVIICGEEAAVDLEHVPRDLADEVQGGIAHTKIIHGGKDTALLQAGNNALQVAEFDIRCRFRELDLDVLMRYLMRVDGFHDMLQQVHIAEVLARQVDGYADGLAVLIEPSADVGTDVVQHIEIQLADILGLLQKRDELRRRDHGAAAEPAAECLGADELAGLHIDLRLVIHTELPVTQRNGEELLDAPRLLLSLE